MDSLLLEFGSNPASPQKRDPMLIPLLRGITDLIEGEEEEEYEDLLEDLPKATANVEPKPKKPRFKKGMY